MKKIILVFFLLFLVSGCEKKVTYDVSFDTGGGSIIESQKVAENELVTIPSTPIKEGYTFVNWYKDELFSYVWIFEDYTITKDTVLYAKWEINQYDVTFYDGADIISKITVNYNETVSVPNNPKKEGYKFIGWYENDSPFNFDTLIKENKGLYAKWENLVYDYNSLDLDNKKSLSPDGFVNKYISDFSIYENTEHYRVVSTAEELAKAIYDAKYNYTNTWNDSTNKVKQTLINEGSVHVIEIANDLNLGYNVISSAAKANGIITDYKTNGALSEMVLTNGISQIKVENISNLLIYSKSGAKLTHAGFKLTSCHNVVFRNIEMDELWEWEDSYTKDVEKIGDYDKFGWAYFKISHCGQIWIDHMTFGKSYDGQIDYANPVSNSISTKIRLAYGSDGSNGLHISYCNFNAGSDNKEGYVYKMMKDIEDSYLEGSSKYLYYNSLRDNGLSFEDILYGIAIPQKKGFLFGDNAESKDDFYYNKEMKVSFNSCRIINFCDRIPKVRGGIVYMYNTIVDSLEYMDYRTKIRAYADSAVKKVNSSWKCACVSQGFLVSYGGYLHLENCIIRGVETLIKNNDTKTNPFTENIGYYNFVNVLYQPASNKNEVIGSTIGDNKQSQYIKNMANLKVSSSIWPYYSGGAPFNPILIELNLLDNHIENEIYGVGINKYVISWLDTNLDLER